MVKGQLNLCGHCKIRCRSNSVFCSLCSNWFHAKCEHLTPKDVNVLAEVKRGYICSTCAGDNFEMSLARITEAAKCYSYMEKVVKRESVIMRKPFAVTDELPTIHVYFQRSQDTVSRRLQEKYGFMLERRPLYVSGDGNCLFNAVSVALCGSQKLAAELRVRTVIEMVMNAAKYKNSPNAKTYLTLAPYYKDACVDCGKNGAYSSVWTMVALTAVIGRPIHSVYPPCNGTEGSNGFIYRTLNTTFKPDKNCRIQPIYIMWTSTMEHSKGSWSPNHFVPLLALTDVPGIPSDMGTSQTNFSSSSPTYSQDFPDLSSSFEMAQSPKRQRLSISPKKTSSALPRQPDKLNSYTPKTHSTPVNSQIINEMSSFVVTPLQKSSSVSLNQGIASPEGQQASNSKVQFNTEPYKRNSPNHPEYDHSIENKTYVIHDSTQDLGKCHIEPNKQVSKEDSDEEIVECEYSKESSIPSSEPVRNDGEQQVHYNQLPKKGLTAKQIFDIVMNQSSILPSVPKGLKSDCYFVVNNEENVKKNGNKVNCEYHDDCGAWNSNNTRTVDMAYVHTNSSLHHVRKKEGKYCVKRKISNKDVWKPLEPQPNENDIVVLHKYYATLKRSSEFAKRVSWFKKLPAGSEEKLSVAVIEYIGSYPSSLSHHGGTKIQNKQYVRTDPMTKQKVEEKLKHNVPVRTIFKDLQKEDLESAPRDYNVIQYLKQKEKKKSSNTPTGNLADEMLEVFRLLRTNPFVQQVNSTKAHAPTIILYSNDQIKDFRFFISKKSGHVVGVDRTFNLGATFVTTFTYKNLRVLKNKTRDHPVFFGPMFLHWDASFTTYHYFFSHVRAILGDTIGDTELKVGEGFKVGSDDEKALTKALDVCFSESERYLCTKHMKDNLNHFLIKKEEIDEQKRRRIVNEIFGPGGLASSNDSFIFESSAARLKAQYRQYENFTKYFETSLKSRILKNVNKHIRGQKNEPLWTNNACESLNAVLKLDIDWKPKKIPELIEILSEAVNVQMLDLKAALYGSGNYHLAPGYGHYLVPLSIWSMKSDEEKKKLFDDFLQDKKRTKKSGTVKAHYVSFEVVNEQKLAKKPGQKRKRTRTIKKFL